MDLFRLLSSGGVIDNFLLPTLDEKSGKKKETLFMLLSFKSSSNIP
jgi:hypothetical protein